MKNLIFLLLGPLVSIILFLIPTPVWINTGAWHFLSLVCWILIWWMTEIVPIAVTSLLPLVLFPVTGVITEDKVAVNYSNPVIFLFMGGFFIAEALKKWKLHRRFAYFILYLFGKNVQGLLAGFMLATAALSMWISNTATTIMMAAIGLSVVETISNLEFTDKKQIRMFGTALMLSIAYSASIGGISTLVGTPPNLLFAGFTKDNLNISVSMAEWMKTTAPFVILMGVITWIYIIFYFSSIRYIPFRQIRELLKKERSQFKSLGSHEWTVIIIFVTTAIFWILRGTLSGILNIELTDSIIAIVASILLFSLPESIRNKSFLLDWDTARGIPWGILLMFGAGLSLAAGFKETGLDIVVADNIGSLTYLPEWAVMFVLVTFSIFLTELISNTAAAATLLPLVLSVSEALGIPFMYLAIPVTMVCSAAFMLPVATPPNAIAFSFDYFPVSTMAKAGFMLNLIGILIIMLLGLIGWF